jgi:hypothetical protein
MSDDSPTVARPQAGIEDADSALGNIESLSASDEDSVISAAVDYVEESDVGITMTELAADICSQMMDKNRSG